MLLDKTIKIKWHPNNKETYTGKGYIFTKWKDEFEIKVEDLTDGSHNLVNIKCDCESCKSPYLKPIEWRAYIKHTHKDGKYYCMRCANKLYGGETRRLIALTKGKSFEQWCIENNRQDILDRWDYELNDCKPSDFGYSSNSKYYIKCPENKHESELKSINDFTGGHEGVMNCKGCNSFGQFLINTLGKDALKLYWDYDKNTIDPFKIDKSCSNDVWIKCQEKDYHGSYYMRCANFVLGNRCTYCCNFHGKVHPLDSLVALYPETIDLWSDKNSKSPYEYAPYSGTYVYWKCSEGKHVDYKRIISSSTIYEFRCPQCQASEGEQRVENWLLKTDMQYTPQKTFDGLLGINNGKLSYDFYLPEYNLLIEYQGEQHERFLKGIHIFMSVFERQKEHDKRKKEYALNNGYNFLEIWYKDFNKVEEILTERICLDRKQDKFNKILN